MLLTERNIDTNLMVSDSVKAINQRPTKPLTPSSLVYVATGLTAPQNSVDDGINITTYRKLKLSYPTYKEVRDRNLSGIYRKNECKYVNVKYDEYAESKEFENISTNSNDNRNSATVEAVVNNDNKNNILVTQEIDNDEIDLDVVNGLLNLSNQKIENKKSSDNDDLHLKDNASSVESLELELEAPSIKDTDSKNDASSTNKIISKKRYRSESEDLDYEEPKPQTRKKIKKASVKDFSHPIPTRLLITSDTKVFVDTGLDAPKDSEIDGETIITWGELKKRFPDIAQKTRKMNKDYLARGSKSLQSILTKAGKNHPKHTQAIDHAESIAVPVPSTSERDEAKAEAVTPQIPTTIIEYIEDDEGKVYQIETSSKNANVIPSNNPVASPTGQSMIGATHTIFFRSDTIHSPLPLTPSPVLTIKAQVVGEVRKVAESMKKII